jgi:hypothetical protein
MTQIYLYRDSELKAFRAFDTKTGEEVKVRLAECTKTDGNLHAYGFNGERWVIAPWDRKAELLMSSTEY